MVLNARIEKNPVLTVLNQFAILDFQLGPDLNAEPATFVPLFGAFRQLSVVSAICFRTENSPPFYFLGN